MNAQLSLAKDKIKVLLLEGIHDSAVELFTAAGYSNVTRLTKALDGEALKEALHGVHIVGIRSRTKLTEEIFAAADRLIAAHLASRIGASFKARIAGWFAQPCSTARFARPVQTSIGPRSSRWYRGWRRTMARAYRQSPPDPPAAPATSSPKTTS